MKNNTLIFYITNNGLTVAKGLKTLYPDARVLKFKPVGANSRSPLQRYWPGSKNLIFIMASGIVVRTIAPLIKDKKTDPAVVVIDEKGKYAISLLSGHLGGANKVAKEIADFLKGEAVITTASDVNNLPSIDLWAREKNLVIENDKALSRVASKLINKGTLKVYIDQNKEQRAKNTDIKLPEEFIQVDTPDNADVLITNSKLQTPGPKLYLRPKNLVIGIGCNSGTSKMEIDNAVRKVLAANDLSFLSIHSLTTIDKKGNEPGLIAFAGKYNFEVRTFSPDELNRVKGVIKSKTVFRAVGANAVAEPAALLASGDDNLLVPKQKIGNVTVAIAERVESQESRVKKKEDSKFNIQGPNPLTKLLTHSSRLYIVGTGPGGIEYITPRAQEAIKESDVIVGYGTYLDLIEELIKNKEVVSTGMTQEVDRCKKAVELALEGKTVSIISGGDPGIYAMAGLVFELLRTQSTEPRAQTQNSKDLSLVTCHSSLSVEVIPGISALNACAARLGAPLMHDFASISLSDRLTPWEVIEKRLEAAAMADFVIALYNPRSKGRQGHINRAQEIILKYRSPNTPVGIVKGAMRENEDIVITNLQDMPAHDIDMQTTVIIGNSHTFSWGNFLITPRGYERKFRI
ncbi:MAG: precorrin-3B C(17)-methyltransferase [Nitrospiraceae bacterium]|nr:MAG: precorrin-3B C(17)-methyltransferase [Nitrospiraceae bacterium]